MSLFEKERERIYSIAVHDVRRLIETTRPDDLLMALIYRRLARAVAEAYKAPVHPFEPDPENDDLELGDE